MSQDKKLQKMAESLYEDLAAPTWHFWRDKDGVVPQLFGLGHAGRPVMVKVARLAVDDPRPKVRGGAVYALSGMLLPFSLGGKDAENWPEADAQNRKARKQIEDAYSTPTLSEEMRQSIHCLTKALGDKDASVRRFTVITLGYAGPYARDFVSLVSPLLQDDDEEIRLWARFCTANMTRCNGETLDYIADKMVDESSDQSLRQAASVAMTFLYGINRRPAVPKILKAIKLCEPSVSQNAITTIQFLLCSDPVGSPDVASAVPALFRALQCQPLAGQAAGALFYIGPAIVPYLIDTVMNHPEKLIRLYAAKALGEIGPVAKEASEALVELRKHVDDDGIVSSALRKIQG